MDPEQYQELLTDIENVRELLRNTQAYLASSTTEEDIEFYQNSVNDLEDILENLLQQFQEEQTYLETKKKDMEEQKGGGLLEREPTILPPDGRKLLEQIANEEIKTIDIVRTPLSSFTKTFLNVISLGQFEKISKKYFDDMFHLSIWINGKYNLEKNEVIAFNQKNPREQGSEVKKVQNIPQGITFQNLIDKTKARMGDKFGKYEAEKNNCQDFITNIFKANNIGDQSDYDFIKQDSQEIFEKLPAFSKVLGNLATKAGAIWNRLLKGEGQMGRGEGMEIHNYQLYKAKCIF